MEATLTSQGHPSAIIGTNKGAINFLKTTIIQHHQLGITSYLPHHFLQALLDAYQLTFKLATASQLALVLESLSEKSGDPSLQALSQNAYSLATTILNLDEARHNLNTLENPPLQALIHEAQGILADHHLYFPQAFHAKLLLHISQQSPIFTHLFVYGFQSSDPITLPLMGLTTACAHHATLCFPYPAKEFPPEALEALPSATTLDSHFTHPPFLELGDTLQLQGTLTGTPPRSRSLSVPSCES